ncbi:hypothetical protein [Aquibium sp. ELW1220]|jgi:hypothetical protein|uniref:hypothetical protein n=1 Tax=Aquibium sp. ELW1220 TaxID=2976766 RepID=UPI0025B13D37|nr:hypothetical protein [Aquibium sp. ELW1220]MDN2584220.1 hypothetical protein [Aquibium sp. ELW1220]
MTSAVVKRSMRERILGADVNATEGSYAAFADMADAYVASTLEAISQIDAATLGADPDPTLVARMADIRARLDGLDELIVTLRELQARAAAQTRPR